MAEPEAKPAATAPGDQPGNAASQTDAPGGAGSAESVIIEAADDDTPDVPAAAAPTGGKVVDLKRIHSIKVLVQAVLGGINMSVAKLSELKEGEVVPLDAKIGDPIDILTNGQLMARGEIVVIEGPEPRFGIQITSLEPQGGSNS